MSVTRGMVLLLLMQMLTGWTVSQKTSGLKMTAQVRLVGSDSSCSGRVEVLLNNQWGTVCDNGWGLNDARVVCRQLGCGNALKATKKASFGQGSGPIWMDNLQCTGHESSVLDCKHQGQGFHSCGHEDDVGAICEGLSTTVSPTTPAPTTQTTKNEMTTTVPTTTPAPKAPSLPVRVVGSDSSCSGRVEIFHNNQWGTVCDNGWGLNDARVVCRQLGCGNALKATKRATFGQGSGPIWIDNLQCTGHESSVSECKHQGLGFHNCGHDDDAGVVCEDLSTTVSPTTPAPTTQTKKKGKHLLTSRTVCSRNQLKVGVPLGSLLSSGLNAFSGHLAAPYCSSYKARGNTLWFEVPRRAGMCGNVLRTNNTHAIYSNVLYFYPPSEHSFALPEMIPFSCTYPLDTNTDIEDCVKPLSGLSGPGTGAYMNLFHDSSYTNTYPGSDVTLAVGSTVHVEVGVAESDPSFAVVLHDCYTTRGSNYDDPMRYYLVHSRCPTNPQYVVENGLPLRARFSAQFFPLQGDNPCTYLHCRVKLCNRMNENCVPTCGRRSYHSAPNFSELAPVTIGPINWEW